MGEVVVYPDRTDAPGVLVTKLHPPLVRKETLRRERLVESLRAGSACKLTLLAAPAGSGKSTLLADWRASEAETRPVAWLSLDEGDNDPVVLWAHGIEALRRSCPTLTTAAPALLGAASIVDVVLPRLVNELAEQESVVLIMDDFHRLSSGPARDSVAWFVDHAPSTVQLVIATRSEPALPLAALRAHGELLELRVADLRFTSAETETFLNDRLHLGLDHDDLDLLTDRTEGWPAGLYLAALSLQGVDDRHAFVRRFGGENRHVVDFLVDEVLDASGPAMQTLMLRSSILERLCGPLCDAVLEQENAGHLLEALAATNLFLIPLDDHGQWYRFHHVFAQLLRVELEHREPGAAAMLHQRACAWHRQHGSRDEAIEHAIEAHEFAEASELIAGSWVGYVNACRYKTVLAWLERLPDEVLGKSAHLLVIKAWAHSLSGRRVETAQAIALVEQLGGLADGPLPDGFASVDASLATLRACMHWGDVGSGLANARRAAELEGPESPYWPVSCWAMGMGQYFSGNSEEADRWFSESAELAPLSEMWLVAASSLAYRSFVAGERGRRDEQSALAEQAATLARQRGVEELDGEVPLALGVSLAAAGSLEEALPLLERGVVDLRSYGQPIDLANALICQARVLRAAGDNDAAARAIAEARATVDSCADPGILDEWLSALERSPHRTSRQGDDELSQRELAVLRALTGPLSEREIGRELYLSHNTIHSHTRSIYRKLGVSSRAEAVERARELGLL